MSRRLGFTVDLASCTGCKACQIACKDKNGLVEGILWRRVAEVNGGSWTKQAATWLDETWTYHVSMACMHCSRPICVEVCPTKAMHKRSDGIVVIDTDRCMGCQYCAWACPYAAPQFDETRGVMTKCDLCRDHIAMGRDPACVEACMMRVLTLVDLNAGEERAKIQRDDIYPLPPANLTEPTTDLVPHRDVERAARGGPRVGNREEI